MTAGEVTNICLNEIRPYLRDDREYSVVKAGGPLFSSASLDSMALVNLVVSLEKAFAIDIDAENLDEVFATLSSLVDYITRKKGTAA